MYDSETIFNLSMTQERLAKALVHWEVIKKVSEIPGCIVECGVFKGTSFARFCMMRQMLGGAFGAKIIGFDVFSDEFPDTEYAEDKAQRDHWINTAGGSSISTEQLSEILRKKGIDNFELIAGDATVTVPNYVKKNRGMKVSLLNLDIDFVEPTLAVLESIFPLMSKGGIILLDNYSGFGSAGHSYHGDTESIDQFFGVRGIEIRRFNYAARPAYIIVD